MLPLILVAVGAYLIGDSVLEDGKKYAKGGKTQGYDDKEDERLAMEHGKMSKKDLDSTHARRDDAQFEERGKMAKGGKLVGKQKNLDVNKNGKLDAEDFKMLRGDKMAKGGNVKDNQMIAKLKKKFATKDLDDDFDFNDDGKFMVDGYLVEVFDWKEEDEKDEYVKKHSKDNYLVPYNSDDDNYYLIVVPKGK